MCLLFVANNTSITKFNGEIKEKKNTMQSACLKDDEANCNYYFAVLLLKSSAYFLLRNDSTDKIGIAFGEQLKIKAVLSAQISGSVVTG